MDWQALNDTQWYQGFLAATPAFLLVAALTIRLAPLERARVLRIAVLYALALLGVFAGGVLGALGLPLAERYVRGISVLVAGIGVVQLTGIFVFQVCLRRLGFPQPRILQDVVVVLAVVVWGLVRLHYAGVDLASIVTTSAVLTAVIGFSLQDTLGNIIGGLALQLDQSFRVGDWIEVDGAAGRVTEIGWRRTAVDRLGGHAAVIPNSVLVKNKFVVLGHDAQYPSLERRWIPFHVDFHHSPAHVIEVVEHALALADVPFVANEPAPRCLLTELASNPATYSVCYWLSNLNEMRSTDSSVRVHVYVALKRAGIPIAVPAQSVFIGQEPEDRGGALGEREMERRLAALGGVELFDAFTPEELRTIAGRLRSVPYALGDVLVRQGAKANRLYIVVEGEAEVYVEDEQRERALVAHLGPGEFFGEMALMTGEPRGATVVAKTDVECYCLDKMAFRDLVVSRPETAEQISAILERRRSERDAALGELEARAAAAAAAGHGDVRDRIWRFFGLKQ